jgi:putative transposase
MRDHHFSGGRCSGRGPKTPDTSREGRFGTAREVARQQIHERIHVDPVRLRIYPELVEPSQPEQNGRHERVHKRLKQQATGPPANTLRGQQRCFDDFRTERNEVRLHEALEHETPASRYEHSQRGFPTKLPPIGCPDHFVKSLMSRNGGFRWARKRVPPSHLLEGQYVGPEEVGDGV